MTFPGLLYHDILGDRCGTSGFESPDADAYKLPRTVFDAHLRALADTRCAVARVTRRADVADSGGIILSFDDGGASALPETAEALAAHGFPGHFFVTTDRIGERGFLGTGEIRALHEAGHVVGSHSCSHPVPISSLGPDRLRDEWARSRAVLEDAIGAPVLTASVPGGFLSAEVARVTADCGYEVLHTSEPVAAPWEAHGIVHLGRYSVMRATTIGTVTSLASGAGSARLRQLVAWRGKRVLKAVGGPAWLAFRRAWFRARTENVA